MCLPNPQSNSPPTIFSNISKKYLKYVCSILTAIILVHATITSDLGFCNSLLMNLSVAHSAGKWFICKSHYINPLHKIIQQAHTTFRKKSKCFTVICKAYVNWTLPICLTSSCLNLFLPVQPHWLLFSSANMHSLFPIQAALWKVSPRYLYGWLFINHVSDQRPTPWRGHSWLFQGLEDLLTAHFFFTLLCSILFLAMKFFIVYDIILKRPFVYTP